MSIESNNLKTDRIYAFDSLRAVMMLLGVVLHSAVSYGGALHGIVWPLRDPDTSLLLDFLVTLIHSFRMPVFFFLSGFFGALLFYEKSPQGMFKNRVNRILLPFLVFLFLIWPLMKFSMAYAEAAFGGSMNAWEDAQSQFTGSISFRPYHLGHLWFLYYLFMISVLAMVSTLVLRKIPVATSAINRFAAFVYGNLFSKIIYLTALPLLVFYFFSIEWVPTSIAFRVNEQVLIFYALFYSGGWLLYKSKYLVGNLMQGNWMSLLIAFGLFSTQYVLYNFLSPEIRMVTNALIVCFFLLGFSGLFLRFGNQHSNAMRYASDSSYWVYIIHFPVAITISGLVSGFDISVYVKFLIVVILTAGISFISYHYLIRSTFVGSFLNGRRY